MKLSELLYAIGKIANERGISTPFIVGGLPRDKLLDRVEDINDVDLTVGDEGSHFLAKEVSIKLKSPNVHYEVRPSGYSRITIGDFSLDFSSNFKVPGIEHILEQYGINNPSEMQKELYSRDFTCNTALMSMDLKKIIDPTGLAVTDINDKTVRTCLSPEVTLGYDNKRIIRAVYLAAKLDFQIADDVKSWIIENAELLSTVKTKYIEKKLNKSIDYNLEYTAQLLSELNLWPHVPPIPSLMPYERR